MKSSPAAELRAAKRFINQSIREELEALKLGKPGWVYAVSNQPGLIKIGMTRRSPEARLASLNTTAVAYDYKLLQAWHHPDPAWLERELHEWFADCRLRPDREHFQTNIRRIRTAVARLTALARPYSTIGNDRREAMRPMRRANPGREKK